MSGTKRNPYFDMLKGIGIIAVVVGHGAIPAVLHHFIFAWHMPLFFLVSGYFFHPKPFKDYLKSNARGLLVPYALTAVVMFILSVCLYYWGVDMNPVNSFIAIFVGAGHPALPVFGHYFTGAIWFLLAMFWCRILYNSIYQKFSNKYIMGGVILVLFLLTVNSYRRFYIPTNLLQGINAMLFFHIGQIAGKYGLAQKPCKWQWVVLTAILLLFSLTVFSTTHIEMAVCKYYCWPLNVVTAIGCVYSLFHFSIWISCNSKIKQFLAYFGSISLLVLCVHIIDLIYGGYITTYHINERLFHIEHWREALFVDVWHLSVALIGSWVLAKSTIIRQIFQIKR